jgi:hypothetical protein
MVYVDELRSYPNGQWCHMWAESLEELHSMADRIGLQRSWFQNRERFPHYDLRPNVREAALRHGAVFKSLKTWLREQNDRP